MTRDIKSGRTQTQMRQRAGRAAKLTLAHRRRTIHLQSLAQPAGQDLAPEQREARQAAVPDDVSC